jgi:hypothetical protein
MLKMKKPLVHWKIFITFVVGLPGRRRGPAVAAAGKA